jgi:probable F420-dependent oxidoreductase
MLLNAPAITVGRVGVWAWSFVTAPAVAARQAAQAIEDLGYGAIWFPETVARETFSASSMLLEATGEITVATGISNIWARDAVAMSAGAQALGEAHPGRFLLGLGVSHPASVANRGGAYRPALTAMREYLTAMEEAPYQGPSPEVPVPVVLGALGPRMLSLAGDRTTGAHPYFVPVDHTRIAREALGTAKLLAPEQAVVVEDDPARARAIARVYTTRYLGLPNYLKNLRRMGWGDAELSDGGSDRLVDALVAWGSPETIAERVSEHFAAGADHVSIQVLTDDGGFALPELEVLAPHLLG